MKYNYTLRILFILFIFLFINGCDEDYGNNSIFKQKESHSASIEDEFKIDIFFSKQTGDYYSNGIDFNITEDINMAKKSVYMGMYKLSNKKITQALIDAYNRGVKVEVTTDDKTISTPKYQELIDAGIKVTHDNNPKALMHEKILVVDNEILWCGSANYTVYAFYRNYENLIRIKSSKISSIFSKEFTLLSHRSGEKYIGGNYNYIDVYFSPDSKFENILIDYIQKSKQSVYFLAYSFTSKNIANALIDAKKRGIEIKGVMDEDKSISQESSSVYSHLLKNDIDVKLSPTNNKLHSKVMIIDNSITITGSYNFTSKANSYNNEDSLIIKNENITKIYTKNFNKIYFK